MKIPYIGPEQHPYQYGAEPFKQVMEEQNGGAVEVQIFPSEQLRAEEETSQMIKQGTIACAVESAGGGLAPFVPSADILHLNFLTRYFSEDFAGCSSLSHSCFFHLCRPKGISSASRSRPKQERPLLSKRKAIL